MSSTNFKIESGAQLLARLVKKPITEFLYPQLIKSELTSGDIVEITASSSNCSSYLLMDLITEALIQTQRKGTLAAAGILVLNTDGNIDYQDLLHVLNKKVHQIIGDPNDRDENEYDELLNEIISNLHILDIYDSSQYYITLLNMENILNKHSNIAIIIFNSISAFYWSEQSYKIMKMHLYLKRIIKIIQKNMKEYKTICIYTKPDYFPSLINDSEVKVNYQVQIYPQHHSNSIYKVIINMPNLQDTKHFSIDNRELHWL